MAEGVETTAQQKFLTGLGCDSLQGFLLGKPMPADEFLAMVKVRLALPVVRTSQRIDYSKLKICVIKKAVV